ncbi:MAG: tRNA 4-thiouridine(8) synthase ThiI [Oscillospiraceae bacterium]|nr:tRNA 4-thiouridine(8) synthase ThiI [Oscillospiraceae bacterium]
MKEIILVKFGEMALKGQNKSSFEDALFRQIKYRLKNIGNFRYSSAQSTIYIEPLEESTDLDEVITILSKVFGIASICRACVCEKDFADIQARTLAYLREQLEDADSFKIEAKRADKKFPMKSPEICRELGSAVCEAFPELTVDVHNPEMTIIVEIRDTGAYVHAGRIKGAGGLPLGTSGKAMLLLSGGIDSPVAGYMIAKRGVIISAIHFVSPPYTSERARLKVEQLCEKMTDYCGDIKFYCVPFTEIQEQLRRRCPEEFFTILMRRIMMIIAQEIAKKENAIALVTGESIGQVASQTLPAMVCTDAVCHMPVFRPMIGMDKTEIIEIARKIDTFDISIQPYEDCCTVFTPRHPKIRTQLDAIEAAQEAGDFSEMIAKAVADTELKVFRVNNHNSYL